MPAPQPYLPGRTRMPGDIPLPEPPPMGAAPPPGQAPSQGGQQFPMIPPPPDNRDTLAQLISMDQGGMPGGGGPPGAASASMPTRPGGLHLDYGPYMNDQPKAPPPEQTLPPGWQPPAPPPQLPPGLFDAMRRPMGPPPGSIPGGPVPGGPDDNGGYGAPYPRPPGLMV